MTNEQIAEVCHEANKAYCKSEGDFSQNHWGGAPEWQRTSAIKGVEFARGGGKSPMDLHQSWCAEKYADGWVYGEVKDPEKKTHPCLVAYGELPLAQRRKDYLFGAIVAVLAARSLELAAR